MNRYLLSVLCVLLLVPAVQAQELDLEKLGSSTTHFCTCATKQVVVSQEGRVVATFELPVRAKLSVTRDGAPVKQPEKKDGTTLITGSVDVRAALGETQLIDMQLENAEVQVELTAQQPPHLEAKKLTKG